MKTGANHGNACDRCPPAMKLKQVCKDMDKLAEDRKLKWHKYGDEKEKLWTRRDQDYEHWEAEVNRRAKTGTLIAIASILAVIMIALFGGIYNTTTNASDNVAKSLEKATDKMEQFQKEIQKEVIAVKLEVIEIGSQLKAHDRRDRGQNKP